MKFFTGLHQPSDVSAAADAGQPFGRAFISIHRLKARRSPVRAPFILDSGAFSVILAKGDYPSSPEVYAQQINRLDWLHPCMLAAVTQDYMCEPFILEKWGRTVEQHQAWTIERYDRIRALAQPYIMPVLQGYAPADYVRHLAAYGPRLKRAAWVGVGSICKRNADPSAVREVLGAILTTRPDLKIHGFGLKLTALADPEIRRMLATADSMAWSDAARKDKRSGRRPDANPNDWREARRYTDRVESLT
jgi:hypothetical protein